jgi:hypothetical protein
VVSLNGAKVGGWAFDANNVLAFEAQAGYSAWLQFTHLPGGPLFMGTFAPCSDEEAPDAAAPEFHVRPGYSSFTYYSGCVAMHMPPCQCMCAC